MPTVWWGNTPGNHRDWQQEEKLQGIDAAAASLNSFNVIQLERPITTAAATAHTADGDAVGVGEHDRVFADLPKQRFR